MGTAAPPTTISFCFGHKMADDASAITRHTAQNSLRSTGQVNGSAVLRSAPALRVTLPARCGSSST